MVYTRGHLDAPIYLDAPCAFGCPLTPPICSNTPHISPMLPCASAYSGGCLHVTQGCEWPFFCLDTPCVWMPPHVSNTCHVFICSPVCLYVLGAIACAMRETSHVGGHRGASAHVSGFWYLSVHSLDVHHDSSCTFLVVHYVPSLYFHYYNYYSSSDCGVFWYVISIIGDHGSLFDGASYNIGSA